MKNWSAASSNGLDVPWICTSFREKNFESWQSICQSNHCSKIVGLSYVVTDYGDGQCVLLRRRRSWFIEDANGSRTGRQDWPEWEILLRNFNEVNTTRTPTHDSQNVVDLLKMTEQQIIQFEVWLNCFCYELFAFNDDLLLFGQLFLWFPTRLDI